MGLDNYFLVLVEAGETAATPDLSGIPEHVTGIFSGKPEASLRGKYYYDMVEKVTGESLYQELIPTSTITEMNERLEHAVWEEVQELVDPNFNYEERDLTFLKAMFKAWSSVKGVVLVGWW